MKNPYQLTAVMANGNHALLGNYMTHSEAVAKVNEIKARQDRIYIEFRIHRFYQYEINLLDDKGEIVRTEYYRNKNGAAKAITAFKKQGYTDVAIQIQFIGGISEA